MTDVFSKEKRSEIMSKVKSKDTSIEVKVRKELWRRGYRYRIHAKLPGKPDIVFPARKTVIFVDGCFWHGCPICKRTMPKTNKQYWKEKIDNNKSRAKKHDKELKKQGWLVIHIWEHQVNKEFEETIDFLVQKLK